MTETNIASYFERKHRDNGEAYYTLKDDRPDWLHDAVREAHDDEFPNDWRFDQCDSIARAIDDGSDDASEIANSLVDVHTIDLLRWVSGDLNRVGIVDEAVEMFGYEAADGLESTIRFGQFICLERMAQTLIDAVNENTEEE